MRKLPYRQNEKGHYIHDGDCYFWSYKICTCGLLHKLMVITVDTKKEYPNLNKELAEQDNVMDHLRNNPAIPIVPMTEEEQQKTMDFLKEQFGFNDGKVEDER